ncbi:unnamed protein product [Porites evermanni]|uniref:6-phosphogluconate dehydrogenase, decarboxylating n=1 Tax=Porites evermanni TaxID=104178 RepID=A0ABN8PDZ7_9CNID|nr:unnamed protein product [Porites evermanni]
MAFDERSHLEECAKKPPQRNVCGHYQSTHRLSILSSHLYRRADIALIGLAVMGQNLILNMNDHGFVVCAFNRTVEKVDRFLENEAKGTKVVGAKSMKEMVATLKKPRRVMMLVKAGPAVDAFIEQLVPLLEAGDIIIDGGNSEYRDSIRRCKELESKGLLFVGSGVSGGEDGARYGPSLMPGGSDAAWSHIKPIFQSIAAKVGSEPCCDWVGGDGAGHFVKMVHNGIEYGDMQLICEAYHLMKNALGMSADEMSKVFADWNKGELDSFLIEITKDILAFKDSDGAPLVEKIRDSAGQKGTGKWTAISALEYGMPVTLIGEFIRCVHFSWLKLTVLSEKNPYFAKHLFAKQELITRARLRGQDFATGKNFSFNQCLTKSFAFFSRESYFIKAIENFFPVAFLGNIKDAFIKNPDLQNLLLDDFFKDAIHKCQDSWRKVVAAAVTLGIPTPAFSTALAFYDGYRSARLPANLIQAQRDYFGAHTYELLSDPGKFVHTNWTGHGETTFVVRRATNNKLPILRDVRNPEDFKAWRTVYENTNFSTEIVWNEIPRKPTPPDEEMNEKWIVVTTINSPTDDVKKLAAIDGWKVVVVGDTKTPADWSHPNCVFLSVERQKTLGYRIHDLLKYRSYPRKNIGYLYAIQHGAKIIYETDDDNSPTSGKITFYQQETGDFFEEKMVYYESGRLIEFLNKWKSDKPDFFSRVLNLSVALAENGFWGINDALLTKAWLTDLVSIGYEMPNIKTALRPCIKVISEEIELHSKEKPSSYLRAGEELKNIL